MEGEELGEIGTQAHVPCLTETTGRNLKTIINNCGEIIGQGTTATPVIRSGQSAHAQRPFLPFLAKGMVAIPVGLSTENIVAT